MLQWQWKNAHKKVVIWGHLVGLVIMLHLFFGCIFFLWLHHGAQHIALTMRQNVSLIPVVFSHKQRASSSAVHTIKGSGELQSNGSKKKSGSVCKTSPFKPALIKKKNTKLVTPKKTPQKKEIPLKKESQPKKKVTPKKAPIQKIEERTVSDVKKEVNSEAVGLPIVAQSLSEQAAACDEVLRIDQEEAALYALVAQQWAPPVGIAVAHECEVSAEIGWKQEISKVWISKKSGILMYDLAARKAVIQTTFPLWTRGKTVIIRFVQ